MCHAPPVAIVTTAMLSINSNQKTMNIEETFEKHDDEYLKFDRVENKRSQRADLHAFMLLDELAPSKKSIVAAAEHDEFWVGVDIEEIEDKLTEDQVIELVRCGVRYGEYGLCLFA